MCRYSAILLFAISSFLLFCSIVQNVHSEESSELLYCDEIRICADTKNEIEYTTFEEIQIHGRWHVRRPRQVPRKNSSSVNYSSSSSLPGAVDSKSGRTYKRAHQKYTKTLPVTRNKSKISRPTSNATQFRQVTSKSNATTRTPGALYRAITRTPQMMLLNKAAAEPIRNVTATAETCKAALTETQPPNSLEDESSPNSLEDVSPPNSLEDDSPADIWREQPHVLCKSAARGPNKEKCHKTVVSCNSNVFRRHLERLHNEVRSHYAENYKVANMRVLSYDRDREFVALCASGECSRKNRRKVGCKYMENVKKVAAEYVLTGSRDRMDPNHLTLLNVLIESFTLTAPEYVLHPGHEYVGCVRRSFNMINSPSNRGYNFILVCGYSGSNFEAPMRGPAASACPPGTEANEKFPALCGRIRDESDDTFKPPFELSKSDQERYMEFGDDCVNIPILEELYKFRERVVPIKNIVAESEYVPLENIDDASSKTERKGEKNNSARKLNYGEEDDNETFMSEILEALEGMHYFMVQNITTTTKATTKASTPHFQDVPRGEIVDESASPEGVHLDVALLAVVVVNLL